jgi:hypothetical protein
MLHFLALLPPSTFLNQDRSSSFGLEKGTLSDFSFVLMIEVLVIFIELATNFSTHCCASVCLTLLGVFAMQAHVFVNWFSQVYDDKKDHLEVLVKSFRSVMDTHVKESSHFLILSITRLNKLIIQTQSKKLINDLSKDIRNSFSDDEKDTDS